MADLTGQQLKNSYQNLVTIDATIESNPTSGQLENGLGNPITALGIGTDSPATALEVVNNTSNLARLRVSTTATTGGNFRGYEFASGSTFKGGLLQDESTDMISIFTPVGGQSVNIDSSGNMGIGTATTTGFDSGADNLIIGSGSSSTGMTIYSGTSGYGSLHFADANSSPANYVGYVNYNHSTNSMQFATDSTERMQIKSSGDISFRDTSTNEAFYWDASEARLGIGTSSPSAPLDIDANSSATNLVLRSRTGSDFSNINFNTDDASTTLVNIGSVGDSFRILTGGLTSLTERMRIDSSGNVGIGVIPKAGGTTWQHVQFGGTGNLIARFSDSTVDASFANNQYVNASNVDSYIATGAAARMFLNDNVITFDQAASGTADSAISWSEAMRIDSSGNVLIGTIATPNGTSVYGSGFIDDTDDANVLKMASSASGPKTLIQFLNPNGTVGSIATNASATAYNTSSDYRLKENVVEMTGALDRVDQLKPSRFNFIADADTTVDGFLAHEVADVVPEAITGEKDATEEYEVTPAVLDNEGNVIEEAVMGTRPIYQGIDQSKLVPLLVGAIQELRAEIEQLKNQ